MLFELHLEDDLGSSTEIFLYETAHSALMRAGQRVTITNFANACTHFTPIKPVHPEQPTTKGKAFRTVKIQLGLGCNMSCSYCNQANHRDAEGPLKQQDVEQFLNGLDDWCRPLPGAKFRIEFWGGEPLLHWNKLKVLAEFVRERFPEAEFSMVTNGTLLNDERADWLIKLNFHVAVSHDGPGQWIRGKDPLKTAVSLAAIRKLVAHDPERIGFNCVLTKDNYSLSAIEKHIRQALGVDTKLILWTEGLLQVEANGSDKVSPMTDEDHQRILKTLTSEMIADPHSNPTMREHMNEFHRSITTARPLTSVGQKCGMDREDIIAVDLKGNVITCQNSPEKKIGHTSAMEDVRLDTATHFSFRKDCKQCPVVQLCKGSCMYLEGSDWESSCANSYTFYSAVLAAALYEFTGKKLVKVKPYSPLNHYQSGAPTAPPAMVENGL